MQGSEPRVWQHSTQRTVERQLVGARAAVIAASCRRRAASPSWGSTSFGTLLIPVWLMTRRHVRARQHLLYLAVVAGGYWLLGMALAFGLAAVRGELQAWLDSTSALTIQLALGTALLVLALVPPRWRPASRPGRGFRDRQLTGTASTRSLVVLALVAIFLEALTMVPYLAAVALVVSADLPTLGTATLLLGYCLVMVLPALVLLLTRRLAAGRVEPLLDRLGRLSGRGGSDAMLWAAGIAGFLLARDAAWRLDALGG